MSDYRYQVTFTSYLGEYFDLTDIEKHSVSLVESGVSGLVADIEDITHTAAGMPGQVVVGQNIKPMVGSLNLLLRTLPDHPLHETWTRWQNAWSTHPHRSGILAVTTTAGTLQTQCRLQKAMREPQYDTRGVSYLQQQIDVISDTGLWVTPTIEAGGGITYTSNPGIVPLTVSATWTGPDQWIRLPSGAKIQLPELAIDHTRTVHLDDTRSCIVESAPGVIDRDTWKRMPAIYPESVAPGASVPWDMSARTKIAWKISYATPWI